MRKLKKKGAALKPVSVAGEQFYKLLEMNPVPDKEAKAEDTRQRRVEKAITLLNAGKV